MGFKFKNYVDKIAKSLIIYKFFITKNNYSKLNSLKKPNMIIKKLITIITAFFMFQAILTISADNVCTFHQGGQIFSLVSLQQSTPYTIYMNSRQHI